MDCLIDLANNPIEVFEEASRLLLKIADNIIKDRNNSKLRILQKRNSTIKEKVLNVLGGKACLKAMGFKEGPHCFVLPQNDSLSNLKLIRLQLDNLKNGNQKLSKTKETNSENLVSMRSSNENGEHSQTKEKKSEVCNNLIPKKFKRIQLPPYTYIFKNGFLKQCEEHFHRVSLYENSYLQDRAISIIPIKELEVKAQIKLRKLQEQIKREKLEDPGVNLQDFLIIELLAWFKNDFFEWVDSPACSKCGQKSKFSHLSKDKKLLKYTTRVEMHKCESCNNLTPFPRYNDPNILLETRKGRCGEWAIVFTLMCRAMAWDCRFILDQTDHVWTEVYSYSQKRWLHCDPCENVCDNPLMYEHGWGKQVSYVMAFSHEEIQDVTWRYTSNFKATLKRRTLCSEKVLIDAMLKLREIRQKVINASRKEYINKRLLSELVEFLVEKQPTDKNKQGRTSGSLDWRLTRGEVQDDSSPLFVWEFDSNDTNQDFICIQYSSALNEYHKTGSSDNKLVYSNWELGVYEYEGISRKVETDWQKSYLCRTELCDKGKVTWKFKITDSSSKFNKIEYDMQNSVFHNGIVEVTMCCNNNKSVLLAEDKGVSEDFKGQDEIWITAELHGGKGDTAWQHAQLFREDCNESQFTFNIRFTFMKDT